MYPSYNKKQIVFIKTFVVFQRILRDTLYTLAYGKNHCSSTFVILIQRYFLNASTASSVWRVTHQCFDESNIEIFDCVVMVKDDLRSLEDFPYFIEDWQTNSCVPFRIDWSMIF